VRQYEGSTCLETDDDGIDSPPHRDAELAELEDIVDELEPDLTLVVRLRFFEGLTITQISKRTGKTRDAVKWLLDRAMVTLRNRYDVSILKARAKHQQQRNAS
jgi:RNA polymerase sigma factor (sigma-70 family)